MAIISKPYTFTVGATIIAAEHNSNFDTIYNDYNGNITNANLAASFALTDDKLDQITTYGKVHGSSITNISSLNAAAGKVPAANLDLISMVSGVTSGPLATIYGGTGTTANANAAYGVARLDSSGTLSTVVPLVKVGYFTRDLSTASGNQTVSGVGFKPKYVTFASGTTGLPGGGTGTSQASVNGSDDGTTANCIWFDLNTADNTWNIDTANSIHYYIGGAGGTAKIGSFNGDGFVVAWTKVNSPTGTVHVIYTAIG